MNYPADPNLLPDDAKNFAHGDALPRPMGNLQEVAENFACRKTREGLRDTRGTTFMDAAAALESPTT
eukprot:2528235-Pyramimonas_sp.AAC.1